MIPTDARRAWGWTGNVITDPRVVHFWDDKKLVGRWFSEKGNPDTSDPGVTWDAYFLYGPDAEWNDKPEPLVNWGAPVRNEYDTLEKNLVPLLK